MVSRSRDGPVKTLCFNQRCHGGLVMGVLRKDLEKRERWTASRF